jgi:hypothetical protein
MLTTQISKKDLYPNQIPATDPVQRSSLPLKQPSSSIKKPVLTAAVTHGIKDFAGQFFGRTAGLAVLAGLTSITSAETPLRVIAGGIGAITAGTQAFLIGRHQIGDKTLSQKAALAICTLSVAAAGAGISAYGSFQPVVVLASCSAAVAVASLLKFCGHKKHYDENTTEGFKALAFTAAVAYSVTGAGMLISSWSPQESHIAARSIAQLIESSIIELCKASLEQLGPSVDKHVLSFTGNAGALLMGLPFYTAATVLLNGVVSGALQPPVDSTKFVELWLPLIVGGLANTVRGSVNACSVAYLASNNIGLHESDKTLLRPNAWIKKPDCHKLAQKTAVRFFLSSSRNTLYFYMRDKGLAIMPAACIAQACYSIFAQQRDLIYELMQGKGWSEPVLNQRKPTTRLRQVLVETDSPEISKTESEIKAAIYMHAALHSSSSSSSEESDLSDVSDISHDNEADDSDIVSEESQSSH